VDACQKINELMLESLETQKIELACVDVVDESGSTDIQRQDRCTPFKVLVKKTYEFANKV
uniref:Uncharacterized protein n=1 Tax=Amphimedon queenslandica TaxID=400682 RepID=A0A1X7VXG4_AMPQE